jgi:hypothetical protein
VDKIDGIGFFAWSVVMASLGFDTWQLLGVQAGWLAAFYIGRLVIDRWIARA